MKYWFKVLVKKVVIRLYIVDINR